MPVRQEGIRSSRLAFTFLLRKKSKQKGAMMGLLLVCNHPLRKT